MSFKKLVFGFIAVAAMLLWAPGCYYDKTVLIEEEVDENTEISFAQDIIPIFNASCNVSGCHNTGGTAPDLTAGKAYNSLIGGSFINLTAPESSELYQWLTGKRTLPMPLSGPDATINAKVLLWIKQGARNN